MGNYRPWGPHGAEGSPLDVRPNPTPSSSGQQLGGGDPDVAQPSSGGSGGPLASFAASLIMVPFVWLFWICLYPLTALAGIGAGLTATQICSRFLAADESQVATGFGIVLAFAMFVVMSRVEYKLAQNDAYRKSRHVVRLILLGVFAVPWFIGFMGDAATRRASFAYMLTILTHPLYLLRQFANPVNLAIVVAVMVGMHFLLTKADRLRAFWHRRLSWLGLK